MNLPLRQLKKMVILVIGGSVLLLGVILLVMPGPAFIVIPAGLAILAVEFEWARRLLKRAKSFYDTQSEAWEHKYEKEVHAMATSVCRAVFYTDKDRWTVDSVILANTAWRRFIGLMGHAPLGNGRGLFLAPCGSVHTLFMRFDLDLVFISRDFRVVRVVKSVKPWRMAWGGWSAWGVLELQAGWFPCEKLAPGTNMKFENPEP